MKPVFKSCEVSPAIAATIQIILPIQMEPIIPVVPVVPVAFKIKVEIIKVAIDVYKRQMLTIVWVVIPQNYLKILRLHQIQIMKNIEINIM